MQMDEDEVAGGPRGDPADVLRLLIVNEHLMVAEALAARMSAAPGLWVAGCTTTSDSRLPDKARWLRPDVIIIDVEPLGYAVGEVLQWLAAAWSPAHVVVISSSGNIDHAVAAARFGASAWVSTDQGTDDLETVVRGVCNGQSWFPPAMLGKILRELRQDISQARDSSGSLDMLTRRERDVLVCMVEGKKGREIAKELTISMDTVRTHTRAIFSKLDVHSRLEAVSRARAAGLRPRLQAAASSERASSPAILSATVQPAVPIARRRLPPASHR